MRKADAFGRHVVPGGSNKSDASKKWTQVHYLEDTKVVSCRFRRCSRRDLRTPKMLISAGLVLVTSSAENDPPDFDFDFSL